MKVALVTPNMNGGGAQRVLAHMANHRAAHGNDVSVVTIHPRNANAYGLNDSISVHEVAGLRAQYAPLADDVRKILRFWGRALKIFAAVSRAFGGKTGAGLFLIQKLDHVLAIRHRLVEIDPDVIISFMDTTNIRVLMAGKDISVPIIATEHNHPWEASLGSRELERLRKSTYLTADALVLLTEDAVPFFSWLPPDRVHVIPNPVLPRTGVAQPFRVTGPNDQKTLIAMGRLEPQKGYDMLIEAFRRIAPEHPRWRLDIWGKGSLERDLGEAISQADLEGLVTLKGFTNAPEQVLAGADLFVMSSRFEGFPMVLTEALAAGLPVVSFDCPSGPRHVVRHGVDGVLVPPEDVNALAQALSRLMGDEAERKRLAARGPEVVDRFHIDKVMRMWDELISEVAGRPPARVLEKRIAI